MTKWVPAPQEPSAASYYIRACLYGLLGFVMLCVVGTSVYHYCGPDAPPPSAGEAPKKKPTEIPYGVSKARALEYKKLPDTITTYVWMGYDHSTPPRNLVANRWEHFGQITATEELGSIIDMTGTLIKVTVQKDPVWNTWEPTE